MNVMNGCYQNMVIKKKVPIEEEDSIERIDPLLHDADIGTEYNSDNDENESGEKGINKLTDLINAINKVLHSSDKKRKGNINIRQEIGIAKGQAINAYLEQEYNTRIELWDILAANVLDLSQSVDSHGFDTSAEALKGLNTTVELNELRGTNLNRGLK